LRATEATAAQWNRPRWRLPAVHGGHSGNRGSGSTSPSRGKRAPPFASMSTVAGKGGPPARAGRRRPSSGGRWRPLSSIRPEDDAGDERIGLRAAVARTSSSRRSRWALPAGNQRRRRSPWAPGRAVVRRGRLGLQTLTIPALYGPPTAPWAYWARWERLRPAGSGGTGKGLLVLRERQGQLARLRLH
jgi:hypothetical protein